MHQIKNGTANETVSETIESIRRLILKQLILYPTTFATYARLFSCSNIGIV